MKQREKRKMEAECKQTKVINEVNNPLQPQNELEKAWAPWDEQKNKVRSMIRSTKIEYQKKLLEEIGKPEGESNIWKAVDKICFRKNKKPNNGTLRKVNGVWCENDEEELDEVAKFCEKELSQHRWQENGNPEEKEKNSTENPVEPMKVTAADVKESFRKTHHSKSNPQWSVPNKLWVISEDKIATHLAEAWTKLGNEKYPTSWEKQKVAWIPKAGKNDGLANQRTGITILDCGAKAYLTWLQKQTSKKLKPFWQNDKRIEYGGLPGKGTAQAISKVLKVRRTCKKHGVSTFTFLEDAKKAFDTLSRKRSISQWGKELGEKTEIYQRHVKRHENIIAVTQAGNQTLQMQVVEGVAQGDPNGPPMFSLGYAGAIEEIEEKQNSENIEPIVGILHANKGIFQEEESAELSATLYIDDLIDIRGYKGKMEVEEVKTWLKKLIASIIDAQSEWGIEANDEKSVLILDLRGKNSKKYEHSWEVLSKE